MAWGRLDDKLHSSVKWRRATKGARALWTTAHSWCSDQENGGHVPSDMLRVLDGTPAEAKTLVAVGLWDPSDDDGWDFHDWSDYNPDAASAKATKAAKSEGGRFGNHERWHVKRRLRVEGCEFCESDNRSVSDRTTESGANPPDPTRPDPIPTTEGREPNDRSRRASDDAHPQPEFQNVGAVLTAYGMPEHERRDYLAFLHRNGLRNPAALITKAHRDGSLRDRIDEWRLVRDAAQDPAARPPGKRTTDDRVRDGLALAAKFAAEESGQNVIPIRQIGDGT